MLESLRKYLEDFVSDCVSNDKPVPPKVLKFLISPMNNLIDVGNDEDDEMDDTAFEQFMVNFESFLITKEKTDDEKILCMKKQRLQEGIDRFTALSNSYENIRTERTLASNSVLTLLQEIQALKENLEIFLVNGADIEEISMSICATKVNQVCKKLITTPLKFIPDISKALMKLEGILTEEKCRLEKLVCEKRLLMERYKDVEDSAEFRKISSDYKKLLARKKVLM